MTGSAGILGAGGEERHDVRNIDVIAVGIVLGVVLAGTASAQTSPALGQPAPAPGTTKPAAPVVPRPAAPAALPDTRIAFVNTEAFADEKQGITKYVVAMKSVEREFQPRQTELNTVKAKISGIGDEITKLRAGLSDAKTIQAKQDESDRLQRDLKRLTEDAQAEFRKRSDEVMGPIMQEIGKALDQFATQRGITMIFDVSKLAPAILTLNPAADVTQAFVADYNSKNPAPSTAPANLAPKAPPSTIK